MFVFRCGFYLLLLVVAATYMAWVARIIKQRVVIISGSDRGDCEVFLTFPRRRAKRYSSKLLVDCVILILCWLCGTLLRVWRVMPISA